MADSSFPHRPAQPPQAPAAVELVAPRAPLSAIHEVLATSIHDVVNERRARSLVADFYRITRWMENEWWLRRMTAPDRLG